MIDVTFRDVRVEIWALDEPQEELVDYLEVRPGELQDGFILFGIEDIAGGVDGRGYRTEEIGSELELGVRRDGLVIVRKEPTIFTTSGYIFSVITLR